MFETLLAMFRDPGGRTTEGAAIDERVALAALMIHTIAADGAATPAERDNLTATLAKTFRIGSAETERLVEEARRRDLESVDLSDFTAVLNRRMDLAGRARIVEMLWDLVYADGAAQEIEDATVWRIADMLGVPAETRNKLRQRIAATRRAP
ncbi:TerB family tellurite resistance protein [Methylobrevis pamukkalensis]|uniref:Tellurite resistance protein TerB n=1 Tax=Methylobrevis pamukkalensis TaxID=1439726 RepID=A0A1E3H4L8_9HYPH|nr:TerB family tellurite resistance protein [Methylobrevis pamukkalensis]ODN71095.1 Tellurite resistance protein TerB [Methylobrevis pamukkalensis]